MTQQQVLEEIERFPIADQVELVEKILRNVRADLRSIESNGKENKVGAKARV